MTESLNDCRMEFEKWASKYNLSKHSLTGEYIDFVTSSLWLAWQAGWEARK